ncbi:MAG: quinol:cytochrome C oxidoreductase [Chitinophagales bacterium]
MESFTFSSKEKKYSFILIGIGLLLMLFGIFTNSGNPTRIATAFMYNNVFFLMIALTALFFIAAHTVGWGGWYIILRRVSEAMANYIYVGAVFTVIILAFGMQSIYHWAQPGAAAHDPLNLLAGKEPYLNVSFFWIRTIVYVTLWSLFTWLLRKNSLANDLNPSIALYEKSKVYAAGFLFVFAISSSTASWDYTMSVQPHWYSTLWGWYNFISAFVTSCAILSLFIMYLKDQGYLTEVTDEHLHDIGKFMFAFSIAWAYLFFSQFMLIWYANIPEETGYYLLRGQNYPLTMYIAFALNFIAPFFILITKAAKRNYTVMRVLACAIIIGHWMDFYQMMMPAALKENGVAFSSIGALEIGIGLFFAGLFVYVVFHSLSKASLKAEGHPFYRESILHHT